MKRTISCIREPFCGLSHLAGAVLSLAALISLLILADGRLWHVLGFAIFGGSLFLLYTASTLYHSLPVEERHIDRLRLFDYVAIFLLIAGTYAPVCLVSLRGAWGWALLGVEYGLAFLGILQVLVWKGEPHWLRVVIYLCMGWLAVIAVEPLRQAMPPAALYWLFGGGIAYSVGTVVFATDRPHLWPGRFSAHDLWHVFVLAGSACHFILMLLLAR